MIVLHIAPINLNIANGFRFSVPGLIEAQSKLDDIKVGLMNTKLDQLNSEGNIESVNMDYNIKNNTYPFNNPDIVIFHGVYIFEYVKIYKYLRKANIPYVIVPRVSLTEGAQNQSRLKKRIGNALFFNKFINRASKIQFLTENEMETSVGYNKNYFIVSNGIDVCDYEREPTKEGTNIVFMGRYDLNHKGLDVLIETLVKYKNEFLNEKVVFNLFGSDHKEGKLFLNDSVKKYELQELLNINSPVYGEEKKKILRMADLFIAPSRFEGHPMAVLEAMANGIPCLVTKNTNVQDEIILFKAGWAIELDVYNIGATILDVIADKEEIKRRGVNAHNLVLKKYSWKKIARDSIYNYQIIINQIE